MWDHRSCSSSKGLLTGKYIQKNNIGTRDHRTFIRHGESFDKGETFSGVPICWTRSAVKTQESFPKMSFSYGTALISHV
jgi:hypothetical protein